MAIKVSLKYFDKKILGMHMQSSGKKQNMKAILKREEVKGYKTANNQC
jgi:hypothetical protein